MKIQKLPLGVEAPLKIKEIFLFDSFFPAQTNKYTKYLVQHL